MGSTLTKLRGASITDLIGLFSRRSRRLLARRQLRQVADGVHQHRADRPHDRHDLRRRRAGLHARLRHPAADQLRARRRVRALGPRREHGHRQRPRPRRELEHARGHRRPRFHARRDHGRLLALQRVDRTSGLPTAAPRAEAGAADHRSRHVVHRPEHRPRVLRRQLPHRAELHPSHERDPHRQRRRTPGARPRC